MVNPELYGNTSEELKQLAINGDDDALEILTERAERDQEAGFMVNEVNVARASKEDTTQPKEEEQDTPPEDKAISLEVSKYLVLDTDNNRMIVNTDDLKPYLEENNAGDLFDGIMFTFDEQTKAAEMELHIVTNEDENNDTV